MYFFVPCLLRDSENEEYPLPAVSRLANQGEQWLHYFIYVQIAHKQS